MGPKLNAAVGGAERKDRGPGRGGRGAVRRGKAAGRGGRQTGQRPAAGAEGTCTPRELCGEARVSPGRCCVLEVAGCAPGSREEARCPFCSRGSFLLLLPANRGKGHRRCQAFGAQLLRFLALAALASLPEAPDPGEVGGCPVPAVTRSLSSRAARSYSGSGPLCVPRPGGPGGPRPVGEPGGPAGRAPGPADPPRASGGGGRWRRLGAPPTDRRRRPAGRCCVPAGAGEDGRGRRPAPSSGGRGRPGCRAQRRGHPRCCLGGAGRGFVRQRSGARGSSETDPQSVHLGAAPDQGEAGRAGRGAEGGEVPGALGAPGDPGARGAEGAGRGRGLGAGPRAGGGAAAQLEGIPGLHSLARPPRWAAREIWGQRPRRRGASAGESVGKSRGAVASSQQGT